MDKEESAYGDFNGEWQLFKAGTSTFDVPSRYSDPEIVKGDGYGKVMCVISYVYNE